MDGHACRPGLRFELPAARVGRGLCKCRCARKVRARLRGGLEQGDESRSLRPGLIAKRRRFAIKKTPQRPHAAAFPFEVRGDQAAMPESVLRSSSYGVATTTSGATA